MKRMPILVAASLALAATMGLTGSPADAGGGRGGGFVVRVGGGGSIDGRFVSITTAIKDPIVPKGFFTLPPPPPQRFFRGFSSVGVIAPPVIVGATPYPYGMYDTPGYDYDSGGYYLWMPDGSPVYYPPDGNGVPPVSYPPPMAYNPPPVAPATSYPSPAYNPPAAYDAPPVPYPPAAYAPPSAQPAAYNPPVYGQPVDRSAAMPSAPPSPTVVQYPTGRYELRGDGTSSPITWVWIPNPPPPPPPPGPPPAGQVFSGDPSMPRRSQLYRWTDDQGVVHLTDRLEGVPPQYRGAAKQTPPS